MDITIIQASKAPELEKVYALRREVFVIEQNVPAEEEFDQWEESSRHFLALDQKSADAVGCARWRRTDSGVKLERFCVSKTCRGKGVGSALLSAVIADIRQYCQADTRLYLHAQLTAIPLYRKHGFEQVGELFLECDIEHYKMTRTLQDSDIGKE